MEVILVRLQLRQRHAGQRNRISVTVIDDSTGGGISCVS
jgi:hypothetical protein